jgi:hypothetical protein
LTDILDFTHKAYLRVQLGDNALDDNEAAKHFTAAINSGAFSFEQAIPSKYDDFVVVRSYDYTELFIPNCVLSAALRVGPEVFVEICEPKTVSCAPSGG